MSARRRSPAPPTPAARVRLLRLDTERVLLLQMQRAARAESTVRLSALAEGLHAVRGIR